MTLKRVSPHSRPIMSSHRLPRLNAMLILQPPHVRKAEPAPKIPDLSDRAVPTVLVVPPPRSNPRPRRHLSSEAVYRREDAQKMLLCAVYEHFTDFSHADMFIRQPLRELGHKTPINYVVCEKTVAKVLSLLQSWSAIDPQES